MAAITAPTVTDTVDGGVLQGARMRKFAITTNAASTSTWASGIDGILAVAWEPTADTELVAPTFSGTTITFTNASAAAFTGNLFVWSAS